MSILIVNLNVLDESVSRKDMPEVMQKVVDLSYNWQSIHFFAAMSEEQLVPIINLCYGTKFFVERKDPKVYEDRKVKCDTSVEIAVWSIEQASYNRAETFWFLCIDDSYLHMVKYLFRTGKKIGLVLCDKDSEELCKEILPYTTELIRFNLGDVENGTDKRRLKAAVG